MQTAAGQDAVRIASGFHEALGITGVILTKMDGDTRGGAALSIKYTVEKPIKFVSSGEKMETLDVFYPERMAQRILGMGDITTLVEKAQQQFDEETAKLQESLGSGNLQIETTTDEAGEFLAELVQAVDDEAKFILSVGLDALGEIAALEGFEAFDNGLHWTGHAA